MRYNPYWCIRSLPTTWTKKMASGRTIEGRCWKNVFATEASSSPPPVHVNRETGEIVATTRRTLEATIERVVANIATHSQKEQRDPTIYVGAPGIAYAFLKMSLFVHNPREAASMVERAKSYLSPHVLATSLKDSERHGVGPSIMCGAAGIHLIHALCGLIENGNQSTEFRDAVAKYASLSDTAMHIDSDEWLYGRSGYLHGCLLLNELVPNSIRVELVDQLASCVINSGKSTSAAIGCADTCPLMYRWMGEEYLGAAHGLIGIIYTLLQVPSVARGQGVELTLIEKSINYLMGIMTRHGNWPAVRQDDEDHLVHFCHGAPGGIYLFCRAWQVFQKKAFLDTAVAAGEAVWRYGLLKKGGGICHGISGNAYALLALYKTTRDILWLERAVFFGLQLSNTDLIAKCPVPDHPSSLYEGEAGWLCLLSDLLHCPADAAFPFFEIGGLAASKQ
eukprot:GHVS01105633.1.p1 GENE.GHVS01105633.1~~GHVS01105633.1.p1  ORF type:complete len:450 (-),score=17.04 GHVS01105633.1:239-1588(-)